ncbi:DUF4352 domain-containing protein [Gracilibacillus massiliensis]|uniref:DUF4352 domain-containing protein n=1 Tax=Gracilibacillus massiliensis TaxID=1564956 RepID=UPI00071C5F08|nr:DUF4352 domain-containing protein [Gracilibacillus massiliensis]
MSKLKLIIMTLLIAILLIACSSDDGNGTEPEENDPDTEEENNGNTEENDADDVTDNESSDSDVSDTENEGESTNDNGKVLSLGETGTIESNVGDYEVTVHSFEFVDEADGNTARLDYFVLVDYTVKNIGDTSINGEDIYRTDIIDDQDLTEGNLYFESINQLEGEIAPGESVDAELLFDSEESEHYQLVFNYASLEENATTLTWEFSSDEVSE